MNVVRNGMVAFKTKQNKIKPKIQNEQIQWGTVNVFNLWLFLVIRDFFFKIFSVFVHSSITLRYWNTASIAKVIYSNITLAVRRYKWSQGGVTLHPGVSSLHVCAAHLNGSRQEGICLHMSPQVITVKVPTCCVKWTQCHSHTILAQTGCVYLAGYHWQPPGGLTRM